MNLPNRPFDEQQNHLFGTCRTDVGWERTVAVSGFPSAIGSQRNIKSNKCFVSCFLEWICLGELDQFFVNGSCVLQRGLVLAGSYGFRHFYEAKNYELHLDLTSCVIEFASWQLLYAQWLY